MAEEMPGFDFNTEVERIYDPLEVAHKVVWPMIDSKWEKSWCDESTNHDEFRFPATGDFKGIEVKIEIAAECEMNYETGEGLKRSAYLAIEEKLTDGLRQFVIDDAKAKLAQSVEAEDEDYDDDEDDDEDEMWPEGEEDDFIVRRGIGFSFDDIGDWHINHYHVIEGPFQRFHVYPDSEASGEDEVADKAKVIDITQKFRPHDLELIEAAAVILSVPEHVLVAIRELELVED